MDPELVGLFHGMLEVQAESLRLQRLLLERLLGVRPPSDGEDVAVPPPTPPSPTPVPHVWPPQAPPPQGERVEPGPAADADAPPAAEAPSATEPPSTAEPSPAVDPPRGDAVRARGARYYQPRPAAAAHIIQPEDLELLRRLQQVREASSLILQFGPYKGTTLAQVAVGHPEYIRELVFSAKRPEVRVAAGRLVEALDAAAEHKRKPTRGAPRHIHAA
jgi:hypothetical protein